jgi:predicted metalloprotease with PDZ domain
MRAFRFIWLLVLIALVGSAWADIYYTVKVDEEARSLRISIAVPVNGDSVSLQMPYWAPGSYRLTNNPDQVRDFTVSAGSFEKVDGNTWKVDTNGLSEVVISYSLNIAISDEICHWSGPSTYLYVVGRKDELIELRVETPDGWRVSCGLDEIEGEKNAFEAKNYDILADNPVTAGKFEMDMYTSHGVPHYIVYRGAFVKDVDREYIKRACKHISDSQGDFFGGLPFKKYVWHFQVNDGIDGAGGLEHLTSTQISFSSGAGPNAIGVFSHEYFHLWNVKRIRSKPLGPFNYNELPVTGALWWLEGVTDYYAHLLLFRYGWTDEQRFHDVLHRNLRAVRSNEARFEVSAHESSLRVGEANNNRGNSQGWRISYYSLGWIVGMCLDIELRHRTNGKHSLDDVTLALWEMCKDDQPGFEEGAIRNLYIEFGGEGIAEFYDRVVMKPGEVPVEEQLAKVGLKLSYIDESFADLGITAVPARNSRGMTVQAVRGGALEKLQRGDVIVSVGGTSCVGESNRAIQTAYNSAIAALEVGIGVEIVAQRGDEQVKVTIVPTHATRRVDVIVETDDATDAQRALRKGWYFAGKR